MGTIENYQYHGGGKSHNEIDSSPWIPFMKMLKWDRPTTIPKFSIRIFGFAVSS